MSDGHRNTLASYIVSVRQHESSMTKEENYESIWITHASEKEKGN